jgi:hypothetical protein
MGGRTGAPALAKIWAAFVDSHAVDGDRPSGGHVAVQKYHGGRNVR